MFRIFTGTRRAYPASWRSALALATSRCWFGSSGTGTAQYLSPGGRTPRRWPRPEPAIWRIAGRARASAIARRTSTLLVGSSSPGAARTGANLPHRERPGADAPGGNLLAAPRRALGDHPVVLAAHVDEEGGER